MVLSVMSACREWNLDRRDGTLMREEICHRFRSDSSRIPRSNSRALSSVFSDQHLPPWIVATSLLRLWVDPAFLSHAHAQSIVDCQIIAYIARSSHPNSAAVDIGGPCKCYSHMQSAHSHVYTYTFDCTLECRRRICPR